jgi:hypothetical protein
MRMMALFKMEFVRYSRIRPLILILVGNIVMHI